MKYAVLALIGTVASQCTVTTQLYKDDACTEGEEDGAATTETGTVDEETEAEDGSKFTITKCDTGADGIVVKTEAGEMTFTSGECKAMAGISMTVTIGGLRLLASSVAAAAGIAALM